MIDDTVKMDNYRKIMHAIINRKSSVLSHFYNEFKIDSVDYYFAQYELTDSSDYDDGEPVVLYFVKSHNNGCVIMSMRTSTVKYHFNFLIFIDMIEHCIVGGEKFYDRFKSVEIPDSLH